MTTATADPGAGEPAADRSDPRLAHRVPLALKRWNEIGVLVAADVHVARRLAALGRDDDGAVALGAALAVRALRLGHVCVDVSTIASTATTDFEPDADLTLLPWPEPTDWRTRLEASPLVAAGDCGFPQRPLRLIGDRLYLDRYWRQECEVAADLTARADLEPTVELTVLRHGLDRLWPVASPDHRDPDRQRLAAAMAVLRSLAVVAGGPGTGKTTTVARILALLADQAEAAGLPFPRVALAAPTGRAAARLQEAVHEEADHLPVSDEVHRWLSTLTASTLHRLLGRRGDSDSRFRHDRRHRLPHDTVVVDETSMVSLPLMANLLDALRPEARLVLVGDPEQLASVEAGAVLGDIVGPAQAGLRIRRATREQAGELGFGRLPATDPPGDTSIGDGIVVLRRVHRFGGTLAELAAAIQTGEADRVMSLVRSGSPELTLVDPEDFGAHPAEVRDPLIAMFAGVAEAARVGDGRDAVRRLGAIRVLCAHRGGPFGVETWTTRIESWLRATIPQFGAGGIWYVGRPLLISVNDYELQLFNGDTGVVGVGPDGQVAVAFERRTGTAWLSPARLPPAETLYATTVHKSQGSQFDRVIVVLPEPTSPILTRQLLYTAVTRAREQVTLIGTEVALRTAVGRPIARASGLRERLWGPET